MSGYYLNERPIEYYGEQFIDLNKRIDSFLRRIFGNFHWEGPRNWIGWAEEGSWTKVGTLDKTLFMFFGIIFMGWIFFYVTYPQFQTQIMIYILLIFWGAHAIIPNYTNIHAPYEYLGSTPTRGMFKKIIIVLIIWFLLYFFIGNLITQEIFILFAPPYSLIINLMMAPLTEALLLGLVLNPTFARWMGIIPGLLFSSMFRAAIHGLIFNWTVNHLIMTFVFGLFFGWLILSHKNGLYEYIGHPLANLLILIINIIK